jgi:hypothetical protein
MSDDYAVEVTIFCDSEDHPTKRAVVERLRGNWGDTPAGTRIAASWVVGPTSTALAGRMPVAAEDLERRRRAISEGVGDLDELGFEPMRTRHSFACPLCPEKLDVVAERLFSVIDTLLFHGLSSISLATLRARVNSSNTTKRD